MVNSVLQNSRAGIDSIDLPFLYMIEVTPFQAVLRGHLMVTLPVVSVIAFFGTLGWLWNGIGALLIGLAVGAVLAWPVWSLLMPRWRDWVEDQGLSGKDVERWAVATGLMWPSGFLLERTEGKRRSGKRGG